MDGQTAKDVAQMVLDFIREIGSAFMDIGFTIAIKRVYFLGIKSLVIAVILVFVSIVAWNIGKKLWKMSKKEENYIDKDMLEVFAVISHLISIAVWIAITSCIISALDYFLNPEWNAIMLIMRLIGAS